MLFTASQFRVEMRDQTYMILFLISLLGLNLYYSFHYILVKDQRFIAVFRIDRYLKFITIV